MPAVDVHGYRKPKIVHVTLLCNSSLGMARTEVARARNSSGGEELHIGNRLGHIKG